MGLTVKDADGLKLKPGLGLRIREGGSRTWIYQYRIGKKQRRMVLGSAKSVPLGLARENAGKLEAKVRLGGDPALAKQTAQEEAGNTLGALLDQYLEARKSEWRPRSEAERRCTSSRLPRCLKRTSPIS
jgi:Arm domain-containing DNA-binding protein